MILLIYYRFHDYNRLTSFVERMHFNRLRLSHDIYINTATSSHLLISTQKLTTELSRTQDFRTHIVIELLSTETNYVESLQHILQRYAQPLRTAEHSGLVDKQIVDAIFYQIPALLRLHERFLGELQARLNEFSATETTIGAVFVEAVSAQLVINLC